MTTQALNPIVFNRSSAQRILSSYVKTVLEVKRVKNSILVVYITFSEKKGATFVSKKAFREEFHRFREEAAKRCFVGLSWGSDTHTVTDPRSKSKTTYYTSLTTCGCMDAQMQMEHWGKAQCKHMKAVAYQLGYSSIEEAIAHQGQRKTLFKSA